MLMLINISGLAERFMTEAMSTLPLMAHETAEKSIDLDDVYAGVDTQMLRLRRDQSIPEWGA